MFSFLSYRIAVAELTENFSFLKKALQDSDANEIKENSIKQPQNEAVNECDDKESVVSNNDMQDSAEKTDSKSAVVFRSSQELESIIIFDLCALSEIATSKSAVLRVKNFQVGCF